jgi:aromatic-L-amino-acid decarboxylase
MRAALEDNVQLAQRLADMVVETSNLELVVKPQLSIVPFRRIPERGSIDQHNSSIAKQMQLDGDAYVTSAIVDGKTVLRPCFTNFRTSLEDVRELLDIVERTGARLERQESEG